MSFDEDLPPRVLGIDPGQKRIGLAVSDPFGNFAVGLDTLSNHPGKDIIPELKAVCDQYEVKTIVMGLPLHMSGDEGEKALEARDLAQKITEALNLHVELMDERLTSKIAEQSLRLQGVQSSRHRKSGIIDQAAAMRILQDYLDRQKARR
jgi:putative Holliday junction resolvase